MKFLRHRATAATLLVLLSTGCGFDERVDSGTSTNWYQICDENAECGSELSCLCGRCTRLCNDATDCGKGTCASAIASVVQCDGAETGLICVSPETDTCSELLLAQKDELEIAQPVDCVPGALICENFDTPFPAEYSTWLAPAPAEAAAHLQDCDTHSGDGALRIHRKGDAWAQTRVQLAQPLSEGETHARFWTKVSSAEPLPEYLIFFELWNDVVVSDDKISVELLPDSSLRLLLGPNGSIHNSEADSFPLDEWVCVELALTMAESGTAELSINGQTVVSRSGVDTLPEVIPHYISTFGGVSAQSGDTFDLVLDDLVVATQPIGCGP